MARPKAKGRETWPKGLNARRRGLNTYYTWTNPLTNEERSLEIKNNFKAAAKKAEKCNALVTLALESRPIERIMEPTRKKITTTEWVEKYTTTLEEFNGKTNVYRSAVSLCKKITEMHGDIDLAEFDTQHAAEVIDHEVNKDHKRQAQSLRSRGIDLFKKAKEKGHYPSSKPNPFSETGTIKARVKRGRLELDQFLEILAHNKSPWEHNACYLALLCAQGPYDLSITQFKKGADWNKMWDAFTDDEDGKAQVPYSYIENDILYATRAKTKALTEIPLCLKMDAINMSLGDIIKQCKKTGTLSKYLIHHIKPIYKAKPGDRVHEHTISRAFRRMRDKTKIDWHPKGPAVFYEIRSLSERTYAEQGIDTTTLLMHKSSETTRIYKDKRTPEFKKLIITQ